MIISNININNLSINVIYDTIIIILIRNINTNVWHNINIMVNYINLWKFHENLEKY